jgi:4'-phosphopantetheinyl transferase EntD
MMPSYDHFQFNNPEFEIAILHMDSIELDSTVLFPSEIVQEQLRSNTKRKKEYLGVRYLRNSLNINSPILYHPNGKPYFSDIELSLSISHTSTQVALAFAKFPIGIDIEEKHRDTAKIINKFAVDDEKNLFKINQKNGFLQLWCAKEAIYKLVDLEHLSFKDEIRILGHQEMNGVVYLSAKILREMPDAEIQIQIRETTHHYIAIAYFRSLP